jgi:hypothetical protein
MHSEVEVTGGWVFARPRRTPSLSRGWLPPSHPPICRPLTSKFHVKASPINVMVFPTKVIVSSFNGRAHLMGCRRPTYWEGSGGRRPAPPPQSPLFRWGGFAPPPPPQKCALRLPKSRPQASRMLLGDRCGGKSFE